MRDNDIIYNLPSRYKSNLVPTNTDIEDFLKPVRQDFRDDFVQDSAKAYRSVLLQVGRVVHFRN